jgi:hypothetical protein
VARDLGLRDPWSLLDEARELPSSAMAGAAFLSDGTKHPAQWAGEPAHLLFGTLASASPPRFCLPQQHAHACSRIVVVHSLQDICICLAAATPGSNHSIHFVDRNSHEMYILFYL